MFQTESCFTLQSKCYGTHHPICSNPMCRTSSTPFFNKHDYAHIDWRNYSFFTWGLLLRRNLAKNSMGSSGLAMSGSNSLLVPMFSSLSQAKEKERNYGLIQISTDREGRVILRRVYDHVLFLGSRHSILYVNNWPKWRTSVLFVMSMYYPWEQHLPWAPVFI